MDKESGKPSKKSEIPNRGLIQLNSQLLEQLMKQNIIGGWINKKELMRFFDYGATQMRQIEPHLRCAKIGRRKFFQVSSIEQLLNKHSL